MSFDSTDIAFSPWSIDSPPSELALIISIFLLPIISTIETTLFKRIQILVVLIISLIAVLRLFNCSQTLVLWHDILAIGFLSITVIYSFTSPTIPAQLFSAFGNILLFLIVSVVFYQYYKHVFAGFVFCALLIATLAIFQSSGRLQLLGLQPNAGVAQLPAIAIPFVASFAYQDGLLNTKSAVGSLGIIMLVNLGLQSGTRTFLLVFPVIAIIALAGNIRNTLTTKLGIFLGITAVSAAVTRTIPAPVWRRMSLDAIIWRRMSLDSIQAGISNRLIANQSIIDNIDQLLLIGIGYGDYGHPILPDTSPHNMFLISTLRFGLPSAILLFGLVALLSRDCLQAVFHRGTKNVFILGACGALLIQLAQLQFHHGLTWDAGWIFFGAVAGMIKAELTSGQIKEDVGI